VIEKLDTPPTSEEELNVRSVFDLGIAQHLYWLWWTNMDELGISQDERWADLEVASELHGGDPVAGLSLPVEVRGCVVDFTDTLGYEIRSEGRVGSRDVSVFIAKGEEAQILSSVKTGWTGSRKVNLPNPRHIEVLRELGFHRARFPNGKEYRLSSLGGLGGIRRIKD
jgi:hypothetical protein